MSMDCYIFTGGSVFADSTEELGLSVKADDTVIAADSGYLLARRLGVTPDLLLGDLDSLDKSKLEEGELDLIEKIIVSPIKDDTDTQLAVDTAIARGASRIILVGGLGGRLDHTLSTVFLLEYVKEKGVDAVITDGKNRVRMMKAAGEEITVRVEKGYKYLSLISLTDKCEGVSVSGVYYPLDRVELTRQYSYAVSNEITEDAAVVSMRNGVLLVVESRD